MHTEPDEAIRDGKDPTARRRCMGIEPVRPQCPPRPDVGDKQGVRRHRGRHLHSSLGMTPAARLVLTSASGGQRRLLWARTGEARAQEFAGAGEGCVAFVEHRGEPLEHVRDARCDFERNGDICRGGPRREPDSVVEQDFV